MTPTTAKFLADAIVVGHLAFVVFALFGAVLALRWRWVAVAHLPAAAWVIYVAANNAVCPLTPMENDLRRTAGQTGYEVGFVEHYLTPVLYPDGLTPEIQRRMGGGVLLFNLACYAGVAARWRLARKRSRQASTVNQGPPDKLPADSVDAPGGDPAPEDDDDNAGPSAGPITRPAAADAQATTPALR